MLAVETVVLFSMKFNLKWTQRTVWFDWSNIWDKTEFKCYIVVFVRWSISSLHYLLPSWLLGLSSPSFVLSLCFKFLQVEWITITYSWAHDFITSMTFPHITFFRLYTSREPVVGPAVEIRSAHSAVSRLTDPELNLTFKLLGFSHLSFPYSMKANVSIDLKLLITLSDTDGLWDNRFRWFVGWVLWHINLCRLFNAKSIFMQIVSSISKNSVQDKNAV